LVLFFVATLTLVPVSAVWADPGQGNGPPSSPGNGNANANGQDHVTENNDSDGIPDDIADDGDNMHPSGNDRSVEPGNSGEVGGSLSDPDDDGRGPDRSNGGPDKPGGSGGVDQADQDWNNGCGNDDDFEDDNEGLCLGQTKEEETATEELFVGSAVDVPTLDSPTPFVGASVDTDTPGSSTPSAPRAPRVAAAAPPAVPAAPAAGSPPAVDTAVAAASNASYHSSNSGGATSIGRRGGMGWLPFTGLSLVGLVLAGLTLTETGRRMMRASRRRIRELGHIGGVEPIEEPKAA
jgi:hypothetical protein